MHVRLTAAAVTGVLHGESLFQGCFVGGCEPVSACASSRMPFSQACVSCRTQPWCSSGNTACALGCTSVAVSRREMCHIRLASCGQPGLCQCKF